MPAPAILLAAALASAAAAPEGAPPEPAPSGLAPAAPAAPPLAPMPDERMEFSIDHRGIMMGRAVIRVGARADGVQPVSLEARTTGLGRVFRFRQLLTSELDLATGLPRSGSLVAEEGDYRHSQLATFDRDANRVTLRQVGKYDRTYALDAPPGALDFLALVFRLRAARLSPGARHEFHVVSGRAISPVVAEVVARETLKTPLGRIAAWKVRIPTAFSGEFREKNPTHVWLSDDPRRVVVRISADFKIGVANARLEQWTPGAEPAPAPVVAPVAAPAPAAAQP